MSRWDRFRARLLSGQADANIDFADLTGFLLRLGFEQRSRGSHHIFTREGVREIIDLQPADDGKAKVYQVRQVRALLEQYGL